MELSARWLGRPEAGRRHLLYCRLWAVGAAVHLTLPDTHEWPWLVPNMLLLAGAVVLAVRGARLGWLLAAAGLAWPLALLHDQLTQSTYLLATAAVGLLSHVGDDAGRRERLDVTFAAAVRVLTVGVYCAAALHKVNDGFLDPSVSCASGGITLLASNWSLPALADPGLMAVWPALFLAVEVLVVVLWIVRPGVGLLLALTMHIPLTIVFAPAFALVMIPGWLTFFTEAELEHLVDSARRRYRVALAIGLTLGATSAGLYFREHWIVYPVWQLVELLLWVLFGFALASLPRRPAGTFGWLCAWREGMGERRALVLGAALLWAANFMTPYLGVQFHHTGAMLSNLRIDEGCWNSRLFPESLRVLDPYVRIDEAEPGDVRGRQVLADLIVERFWSPAQLDEARAGWCDAGAAPLRVSGSYDGQSFEVADLCAEWPLPDVTWGGLRRYQRNVGRVCPQSCIH